MASVGARRQMRTQGGTDSRKTHGGILLGAFHGAPSLYTGWAYLRYPSLIRLLLKRRGIPDRVQNKESKTGSPGGICVLFGNQAIGKILFRVEALTSYAELQAQMMVGSTRDR